MKANLLEITARKRRDPFAVADPADFAFSEGPAINPHIVLSNPLISFYCLDHANRRALFVENRAGRGYVTVAVPVSGAIRKCCEMDAVYQVLESDSQAGSAISQEALRQKKNGLTDIQRADLVRALQPHPTIHTPDYIVPETWIPQ